MEFGVKLRELRKTKGYGLREFATLIELSASYLSNIERGVVSPPSAEVVEKIAKALDGDLDELLVMANRFDDKAIHTIRKYSKRLDGTEKMIAFLDSALKLDDDDEVGGIAGVIEILLSEQVLNNRKVAGVKGARFIFELLANRDDPDQEYSIEMRREIGRTVLNHVSNIAHPGDADLDEESLTVLEEIQRIHEKYNTTDSGGGEEDEHK
jgi:transcriptional regulator with XRE-family HTH domain